MSRVLSRLLLLFGLALLLAGCASPRLTNTWMDPQFQGPPARHVLVLSVSNSDAHRRIFEDTFVAALHAQGVVATPAYPQLPDAGVQPRERIRAAVTASGADTVLVTRLIKIRHQVDISPAPPPPGLFGTGFYGWYDSAWASLPPMVSQYDVLTLETTLWNMHSEHAIWSGTTEAIEPDDIAGFTRRLAGVLIKRMRQDGAL
ncbi:hypothetical protein [Chitiniphilus eburneus]|uniref:hypothetical protein n=1 Tax=Chitiniphilus eburneus TaxID=2571148 RepID=UPI0035D07B9E